MQQKNAETLALKALAWLAGNEELLPVFLNSTGASSEDLRKNVEDAAFLGAVLDFLLMDDAWVLDFANSACVPPEDINKARMYLPGADAMHWT